MTDKWEDLHEQADNVFRVFQDAYARDDIKIGTWAVDLLERIRARQLCRFYSLIAEAIEGRTIDVEGSFHS